MDPEVTPSDYPVTHEPHTFVIYVPGINEARIRISMAVCDEGRCIPNRGGLPPERVPALNPRAALPLQQRYAEAGIEAAHISGIHYWEDTVWYFTMQTQAHLKVATYEGRERSASHCRLQLARLRPYLRTSPNASASEILGY